MATATRAAPAVCQTCETTFPVELDDTWKASGVKTEKHRFSSKTLLVFTKQVVCPGCQAQGIATVALEMPKGVKYEGLPTID
jgi:Fe2+ or Zn2+ uptake regulation protein